MYGAKGLHWCHLAGLAEFPGWEIDVLECMYREDHRTDVGESRRTEELLRHLLNEKKDGGSPEMGARTRVSDRRATAGRANNHNTKRQTLPT